MNQMIGTILLAAVISVSSAHAEEVFDVCVVGGGVAGVSAALQAADVGAKTVLVERGAQVGGNLTVGGVNWPGLFHAWGRQVIDGYGWQLVTNAVAAAGDTLPDFTADVGAEHWRNQIRVNPALWTVLAEEALARANVDLRYHSSPASAVWTNGLWTLELFADGKRRIVKARTLVDATGNGALAALCGARRLRDERTRQPGGFTYLFDPHVRVEDLDLPRLERLRQVAIAEGRLEKGDLCRGVGFFVRECQAMLSGFSGGSDHGTTIANYVADADNSTAALRSETNRRGRAAMLRTYRFLRTLPGLEKTSVVWMSPEVGVRETWRVIGDYVMTGEDYVSGRKFPDAVCYSFYPIDLHSTVKGVEPRHLTRGTIPQVPLRSLIAADVTNVLVAGRCLSADREALSALRVQASCMATGQAAGAAAALAARNGIDVRRINHTELCAVLRAYGAIVPKDK